MTELERFRTNYEREHATTMRVLRAFPADKLDFKPAEKSNTAKDLAWTFFLEGRMLHRALRDEKIMGGDYPQPPATFAEILQTLEAQHQEIMETLRSGEEKMMHGVVEFFTAPKQMGEYSTSDFAWFMLFDQIHHRGQFSVYLRMTDAKVPSIYGPSADEPWM